MDAALSNTVNLFTENSAAVKSRLKWQHSMLQRIAALLYSSEGRAVDCDAIEACMRLIKQQTGVFSAFRGYAKLNIAALLSLADTPEQVFADTLSVYALLKAARFAAGDYLAFAAYQIARQVPPERHAETVDRTRAFYDSMKAEHRLLTGQDDYIFSAMLGISTLDVYMSTARMERIYEELKPVFSSRNEVQSLAQVLTLCADETALYRVIQLHDELKSRRLNYNRAYALSTLGVLALVSEDAPRIAQAVAETYAFLRTQKGFGSFSVTKLERMLLSASLVAFSCLRDGTEGVLGAVLANSITNILIAQQVAVAAAAGSAAAASSASS